MRLAIFCSHPVQYYAPLFRRLSRSVDLVVFYGHRAGAAEQALAGFDTPFEWDVDLLSGYESRFLNNVSPAPGVSNFKGCDVPEVGAVLRAGRFDAVLVFGWYLKFYIQAIVAAKRLGIPVMVRGDSQLSLAGSWFRRVAKQIIYPPALRAIDAALYVGARSYEYYRAYGFPKDRLFHSPHCIDADWFSERATSEARVRVRQRHGLSPVERVVLFAGKLVSFKRPIDLIESAALLDPAPVVLVAGSGLLESEMRERAAALKIRTVFLGFTNQTLMPEVYAAADLLVLPSTGRETWGLVANEALACGKPVVVSDEAGCAPDLAADPRVGRSYRCGDRTALAKAITEMLATAPDTDSIGCVSRAHGLDAAAQGVEAALAHFSVRTRRSGGASRAGVGGRPGQRSGRHWPKSSS